MHDGRTKRRFLVAWLVVLLVHFTLGAALWLSMQAVFPEYASLQLLFGGPLLVEFPLLWAVLERLPS